MTTVFNYTVTSPFAVDQLDAAIRASANITIALANGSTLLGGTALTVTFRADLPDDGTGVASITCQPAVLAAIVASNTGVGLTYTPAPIPVTIPSQPVDTDGSPLARTKQTTTGWTFQDHNFEYQAGTIGSVYSVNCAGVAFGFATLKFYELVSGVESLITGGNLNQTYVTTNAIRTDVVWEMTNDFDVIEGDLRFFDTMTSDVYLFAIIVPDVSYAYGGSRELITGGKNLRFIRPQDPIVVNGRVSKHLVYSATYHTNKFQIILRHVAGFASRFSMAVQLYKL